MKTVTLFRHAKSGEKDNTNIDDFDRPLNNRGLQAAPKMGTAMRERGIRPDLILCSPSVRTRQTLTLATPLAWDVSPPVRYEQALYETDATTLLDYIREAADDVANLMLVGHNPGLQDLAVELAPAHSPLRRDLEAKFPTASIAVFDCDVKLWQDVCPECGTLRLFVTPDTL